MVRSLTHANRGKSLETTIIASQDNRGRKIIRVAKMTAGMKWLPGGKKIAQKGVVDFVGTVVATGRAIHFDAKQTAEKRGFLMSLIEPHQLHHLGVFGDAGAIVGVLAECTAADVRAFFWIPYFSLNVADRQRRPCIPWGEVQRIGSTLTTIDFSRIIEVEQELNTVEKGSR